jgi:hypothetical protein
MVTNFSEELLSPYTGHVPKMEAARSSETLTPIYATTKRDISEVRNPEANKEVWCQHVVSNGRLRSKCDGTREETRFRLSAKPTSPFKSAGASVQSTNGIRGVRISGSNAGYTTFRGSAKATQFICQFPLHFPSRASPCAMTFQLDSTQITVNTLSKNKRLQYTLHFTYEIIRQKHVWWSWTAWSPGT